MNFETYLKIFENSKLLGHVDLFNAPIEIEEKERNNLYAAFVVALEKE